MTESRIPVYKSLVMYTSNLSTAGSYTRAASCCRKALSMAIADFDKKRFPQASQASTAISFYGFLNGYIDW